MPDEKSSAYLRSWVTKWQRAAPLLAAQRDDEIRGSDTVEAIEVLSDAFEYALANMPVSDTSGLVDYYKALRKPNR